MAPSANLSRLFNPWLLHLRKMGLELKCALCLKLLNRPLLLPCDHIFCGSCITSSENGGSQSQCPFCKFYFDDQDLRQVTVLENLVSIYRGLDSAFSQCLAQADMHDFGRSLDECELVGNRNIDDRRSNGNKRVRAGFHSIESDTFVRSSGTKSSAGDLEFNRVEGKMAGYFDAGKVSPSASTRPQANCEQSSECQIGDMDGNLASQTSTGSPPSLNEMRDSDDDNTDPEFQLSAAQLLAKEVDKKGLEFDNLRRAKKQKLVPASGEGTLNNDIHNRAVFLDAENASKLKDPQPGPSTPPGFPSQAKLSCSEQTEFSRSSFPVQPCGDQKISDSDSDVICAFCQSFKISEVSGPMLHFLHGKPVEGDAICQPNVLHVHRNCIDWAPQVYYVGDNVVNLEAELSRGTKLKCSCCGLKGAALGCYAKSCRKCFHAPCAAPVPGCRWDTENFLMLCPTHSSLKFPKERSKSKKSQKTPSPTIQIASQQFNEERGGFAFDASKWVLCGSALSSSEKNLLAKFAKTTGATISKTWNPSVTHVLAATDSNGACSRTLKVLMAILHGRWILNIEWLKACMEVMHPLGEEPYEVGLDVHGRCHGPKRGRLRIIAKEPKLFSGLSFYFCGDFVPSYKGYLEDLVFAAGGVIFTKDTLVSQRFTSAESGSAAVIVYNVEREDIISVQCRREEANEIAAQTGSSVVGHTWILESIAACELQPFA